MVKDTSLPASLLAKRRKELDQIGATGRIPLEDLFRMVYENISENPMAKKHAPAEVKKLKVSIDEVLNNIDEISRIIKKKSGKGPDEPGGKRPTASQTGKAARKAPSTKRRPARK